MEVRFRVDVFACASLSQKIDSNKNLITCVSICALYSLRTTTYTFWWLPYQRESGATLCLFFFTTTFHFLTFRGHFFPFFFLSLLVFSPYFLSSCWLPHILFFSILICVSLFLFTVFFSFSSNIIFECYVSRFCIFLLFSLFILPSGGLVGGFLGSPHQSVFRMADSACATHAPSLLRLSNNPSPPPLVQHGRIHICHEWLHVVRCV